MLLPITNTLTNEDIPQWNNLFPKYTKKVKKFGFEALKGKTLCVWLTFIDETGEKVFCLQMQIKSDFE